MRLERIEINGFKSFSDRSELAFDKGVTAIVGPNGCGKSNVADAITWVMGEQSAKSLRGERMEDVIFNGSDARKPGAAAEVRLRLSGLTVPPRLMAADLGVLDAALARVAERLGYKDLSQGVAGLEGQIPTTENLAALAWREIAGRTGRARLVRVRLWESPDLYVDVEADEAAS